MLYFVFLCKIYDLPSSSFVGPEIAKNMKQQDMMKQGPKTFTKIGVSPRDSKRLMRFSLLSALGVPDVMVLEIDMVAVVFFFFPPLLFLWQMVCALLITALCIAIGLVFHLKHEIDLLQGKCAKFSQNSTLHEVLDLLKGYKLIKMKCWEMNMKQM